MAISAQRRLEPRETRRFGSGRDQYLTPDLTEIQTRSYERFPAARSAAPTKRKDQGIESVLREIFPVESYDKQLTLEYVRYELGKPRYTPEECRQLRLTYGRPFRVWLRLNKEEPIEEEVYLGDMPIMLGGGEFIINGAERVVVSQLHRSPGVDFVMEAGRHVGPQAAQLPHHSRARQLDRNQRHQEGQPDRPHRPERQVLGDDAAAGDGPQVRHRRRPDPRLLRDVGREDRRRPQRRRRSKARSPSTTSSIPADSDRAGEIIVEAGQKITKNAAEIDLHLGRQEGRGHAAAQDPADLQRPGRRRDVQPRRGLAADLPAAAAGQSAAAGKGPAAVPGEVLRRQSLSAGPRRPLPHQPQART